MIEINLLPGGQKRKTRKGPPSLPFKLPQSITFDRWTAFIAAAWVLGPVIGLWLFLGVRGDISDTEVALNQARADSARLARVIDTQASLKARQDTIAQKLEMIQEIDAGRYVWPHIMDELSRALPPYTWIEAVNPAGEAAKPRFQVMGRTGSLPALTRFMDGLEASPFLRDIQLVSSEQSRLEEGNNMVNNFVLIGTYEVPSLEVVETVPLFRDQGAETVAGEGNDGTGTS